MCELAADITLIRKAIMARRLQEDLDSLHAAASDSGILSPFSAEPEENLPRASRDESIRERSEALADAVRAESVRRLARKAGVTAYATSSPDAHTDVVLKTLRQIADVVLFNICKELTRLTVALRKKVVSEDILREALNSFGVKLHGACGERRPTCRSLKHHRASRYGVGGGSEAEILHEVANDSCVYFAYAPFVKLVRLYMSEQLAQGEPIKMSRGVLSCIQQTVELCLVEVLAKARYVMRQTTKKKSDRSSPTRSTLLARDLKTVLTILGPKHPIMSGRLRPAIIYPPVPRPKAKAKAKGGPARAKAAARAKRG